MTPPSDILYPEEGSKVCAKCGFTENADLIGAINVLRAGYARLACEVNGDVGRQQQEPTDVAA